ncbi:PucR family transcriptional regulator [Herbiconiux daphne]|uniref:Helix-turn-helix domain-containing protein n=1 Tax=Herbiconiux daphne TaxID=2970914 RepID=A0ABT2GX22_9MICO|nr:helix-turn-helix domain-containing protein [Herbiconiux daphne]MCS5732501.1 helix-turn-helix domain-containing protein [Herbiconiux daphne]
MCALSDLEPVAQADLDAKARSDLYDLFRVGSTMFERPTTRRTLRLTSAAAKTIAGCTVVAAYVAEGDRLARYSGRANRRLDLLVESCAGSSGALKTGRGWRYALFLRGTSKVKGALVLQTTVEPSPQALFLLCALAEPTGAALATSELIDRERHRVDELRQLGEAREGVNRTLAATVVRLNTHQLILDSFVAAAGTGNGEAQIVAALSAVTRRSVALQDSFGNERAFVGVDGSPAPSNLRAPAGVLTPGWRSTEIRAGEETVGVIGILDPDDDRSDDDRFAVEHASAMIAVELVHHRGVAEVEIRLGRDLADDLVAGADVIDAGARAEMLHFDLSGPQRAVLVSWQHPSPNGFDLGTALGHELAAMRVPALISRRADTVLAIVADRTDLSSLYERLSSALFSERGTIGVGGCCIADDLPRSFAEAGRALKIRVESSRPYGLSNHDDLGLLRILDTSNDGLELNRYLDEWLGTLVEHDRDHHSELVHTLSVYLDCGGNYDRTAGALIIHRSTLRYRLGRIRDLTGRDLADPDSRLNLHIAVRARAALRDGLR